MTRIDLGASVTSPAGKDGTVLDVVVDPRTRTLTHLAVQQGRHGPVRLVPIEHILEADDGLRFADDAPPFDECPVIDHRAVVRTGDVPVADEGWNVGVEEVLALPLFTADFDPGWDEPFFGVESGDGLVVAWHEIPVGESELRHGSEVVDRSGNHLGMIEGFVCDDDGRISHLVLEQGHLFGHRDVLVPARAVAEIRTDRVVLAVTKDEVENLPGGRVHRWWRSRTQREATE